MKHLRGFVARLLLFVMAGFVMHDYMTGQRDLVAVEATLSPLMQQTNAAPAVAEHHIFHLLALGERVGQIPTLHTATEPFYSYDDLLGDPVFPPLYTPPRAL